MEHRHLEELIAVERHYWWHVAKRALVAQVLAQWCPPPAKLVEGGVGGGANLVYWQELGYTVKGLDVMAESVRYCEEVLRCDVQLHDLQDPWPFASGSADVIVTLDTLEHVEDPVRALRCAADVLAPGGLIILSVPAGQYLMGPWDEMAGHYRRYSAKLLCGHAREADLEVQWKSHWNAIGLPAAAPIRLYERIRGRSRRPEFPRTSPRLNELLVWIAGVERRLMRWVSLPIGLSMIGVLRK